MCRASAVPAFISIRIAVGAVYQTLTFSSREAVPSLGVEIRFVNNHRHAMGQRRDDAVRRAGDPSGIGRAPEDVVRVKIQRELRRHVMRDHRVVDVHAPFGVPVVPLVKCRRARSSGSVRGIVNCGDSAAIRAVRGIACRRLRGPSMSRITARGPEGDRESAGSCADRAPRS